ncbi:MAG: 2-amino-4-hydroxy-6-hydroxymethyldihydropteridinepyrophosphokinase [Owenweeksia sp. TMED14]|nr:MAG: 2-amino-4-hydroxy-6-hydroxymethyldihydropteridinepyrophosphokinase [Owenweeksia sp. TMED14]
MDGKIRSTDQRNRVLILLGSNLEDPISVIKAVINDLNKLAPLVKKGSLYRSKSWGFEGEDFLNQMIEVKWEFPLCDLMTCLLDIERKNGRIRNKKLQDYENRVIDIDIILWSEGEYLSPNLEVPHPRMLKRRFVLIPLAEYWSDWTHPNSKSSIVSLLASCSDENLVHLHK